MMTTKDDGLGFARSGLWKNLPLHERVEFAKWGAAEYERDPEGPCKRVWHPIARKAWAAAAMRQAERELEIVDEFPEAPAMETKEESLRPPSTCPSGRSSRRRARSPRATTQASTRSATSVAT